MVFLHVMKTGGEALDDRLSCACQKWKPGCSFIHNEGLDEWHIEGSRHCKDTVEDASGAWAVAASHVWMGLIQVGTPRTLLVTVLRHPTSRVWSFFRYLRRWYVPYQDADLLRHYEIIVNSSYYGTPGANELWKVQRECEFCAKELVNAMTTVFANIPFEVDHAPEYGKYRLADTGFATKNVSTYCFSDSPDRFKVLDAAKRMLIHVDVVGFTERLEEATNVILEQLWSLPPGGLPSSTCSLRHVNVSPQRSGLLPLPSIPDSKTEAAILEFNKLDMELYEFAAQLPQAVSGSASSSRL